MKNLICHRLNQNYGENNYIFFSQRELEPLLEASILLQRETAELNQTKKRFAIVKISFLIPPTKKNFSDWKMNVRTKWKEK